MEANSRREFMTKGATGLTAATLVSLLPKDANTQETGTDCPGPKSETRKLITEASVNSVYDRLGPEIDAIYDDPQFRDSFEPFDLDSFMGLFDSFTESIASYNVFHRRERRLWSLKMRSRRLAGKLETPFIESIPQGRSDYTQAFANVDTMADMLIGSGMDRILEKHITPFTSVFTDETHPFTQMVSRYFRKVGCSQQMINEFAGEFSVINYDFFSSFSGLAELRAFAAEGVAAQLEILDYTQENGFQYLRGQCGPPSWAVIASKILASAGISISAWVVVVIIVALLATLVIICLASPSGSWLRRQCNKLEAKLDIFSF